MRAQKSTKYGSITLFTGPGRTIAANVSIELELEEENIPVYSNIDLIHIEHKSIPDFDTLFDITDSIILWDSIEKEFPKKSYASKRMTALVYFLYQVRRRGVMILLATEDPHKIDRRVYSEVTDHINCSIPEGNVIRIELLPESPKNNPKRKEVYTARLEKPEDYIHLLRKDSIL